MLIHLSRNFDGNPLLPISFKKAVLGESAMGPLGFLGLIESFLGLTASETSPFERRVLYADAMSQVPDLPFFKSTFELDPMGASAYLLKIRDELLLGAPASFSLSSIKNCSKRISELSQIESYFFALNPPQGVPDRLKLVISEISSSSIVLPAMTVTIYEDPILWPALWQQFFKTIIEKGFEFKTISAPANRADKESDIGHALSSLENVSKRDARGDGSLVLINTLTLSEAGDITAAIVEKAQKEFGESVALITNKWDESLDASLERRSLSLVGHNTSRLTADSANLILQYLSICCKPIHPLEFQSWLLNPLNPLSYLTRERAATAIAQTPSIAGIDWTVILEGTDEKTIAKKVLWIDPLLDDTIIDTGSQLADICTSIANWANKKAFSPNQLEYLQKELRDCSRYATAAARYFTRKHKQHFNKTEILKTVSEIINSLAGNRNTPAEKGSIRTADSLNSLVAPLDCVIFWGANRSTVPKEPALFWNSAERKELAALGFSFISPDLLILSSADEWRRAALCASKRFILITTETADGEPDGVHPLWHELSAPFSNSHRLTINSTDLENSINSTPESRSIIAKLLDIETLKTLNTAVKNTEADFWQIKTPVKLTRPESATGLEKLLSCPFRWSLDRVGFIQGSKKFSTSFTLALTGTLCHEVIEAFLGKYRDPSLCSDIVKELSKVFNEKGPEVSESLFLPEEQVICDGVRMQVVKAGKALSDIMIASNLMLDSSEDDLEFELDYGKAHGKPDLVLVRKDDPTIKIIVDLKYGGLSSKRNLVRKGRAVQLSQYSKLVQKKSGLKNMPPVAYFIIRNGVMLTDSSNDKIFSGAIFVTCEKRDEVIWKNICSTANTNLTNMEKGLIMIGYPDEGRLKSLPEENRFAPVCDYCNYGFFCSRTAKGDQ